MVSRKVDDGYLLRLEKGEEIVKTLISFVKEQKIKAGWLSGLGGIVTAQVGYYHLKRKKYVWRHVKDVRELTNLMGNVAWVGDEPLLHLHGTFTDQRNKAHGGHVRMAEAGGTVEIYIRVFKEPMSRAQDPDIGLPLLQL